MARQPNKNNNPGTTVTDADTPGLPAMVEIANQVAIGDAIAAQQRETTLLIGQRMGRSQVINAVQKLLTVTNLLDLQKLKESKNYRGFVHLYEDGKPVTITTWEDYCRLVEVRSRESIDLDLANIKQLGGEFFEAMRTIGIGPGTMRDIRQLPDDTRKALMTAADNGDKDAFLDLAEALISKHAEEKTTLAKRAEDAEGDLEASRQRVAVKEKETEKLTGEVLKLKRRVETQTPDEAAAEIRKEAALFAFRAEHAIRGELRPAFQALIDHAAANGGNHSEFMLGLIAQIEREANVLRAEFGLLKAKPDGEALPDWMRDDVMEKIKADAEGQKPDWLREQEAANA